MNRGLSQYKPMQIELDITQLPTGVERIEAQNYAYQGKSYTLVNAIGSGVVPDGKYLYDPATRRIETQWVQAYSAATKPPRRKPA